MTNTTHTTESLKARLAAYESLSKSGAEAYDLIDTLDGIEMDAADAPEGTLSADDWAFIMSEGKRLEQLSMGAHMSDGLDI